MRISDWSSDVCSSDLCDDGSDASSRADSHLLHHRLERWRLYSQHAASDAAGFDYFRFHVMDCRDNAQFGSSRFWVECPRPSSKKRHEERSEEHTSALQSLMRISYAVFCLKKQNITAYLISRKLITMIVIH